MGFSIPARPDTKIHLNYRYCMADTVFSANFSKLSGPSLGRAVRVNLFVISLEKQMGSPERELCPPATEEDELTLPRASINKMIKELVPTIRVANESRELILNCCTEFIHLLSSEANEVCNQNNKKTINAEHIVAALDRLGFSDYTIEAEAVVRDCKAVAAKRRRQSTRLENLGIPEEELFRQQQELFAKAREEQAMAEQQQWLLLQQQGLIAGNQAPSSYQMSSHTTQPIVPQPPQSDDDDNYN